MDNTPSLDETTIRSLRAAQAAALGARGAGRVAPQLRVVQHWNFPDYKYGPNGPDLGSGQVVAEERPDWTKAAEDILGTFKGSEEYIQLVSAISELKKDVAQPEAFVDSALREFIARVFVKGEALDDHVRESAELFERRAQGLPIPHRAVFRLAGLLVPKSTLSIESKGTSITIRPTNRNDVERSFGAAFSPNPFLGLPDAIAEVVLVGRPFGDVQYQQGRLVSILRLYTNSPISVNGTELYLDRFTEWAGLSLGPILVFPWKKTKLTQEDQLHLGSFWDKVIDRLPPTFGQPTEMAGDAVSVAFGRFNEALDAGGSFEKAVTNSVMGLEALYFKPTGEQAELTYRLSLRVAITLSQLGADPAKTREVVDLAYDVRSEYVHGGKASPKDKKRIVRLYGTLAQFQAELLDLLRRSIVAQLFITMEKEALIDLMDDSLIMGDKAKELNGLLSSVRSLLTPLQSSTARS